MIFVDTSAWFAAYVPTDPHHREFSRRLRAEQVAVVTSDFVVDETITLLLARRERKRALNFGRDLLITGIARLELVDLADLVRAYQVMSQYHDKQWSFTDCTSYALMQRIGLTEVLSLDNHVSQMPGITVVPSS
jgi:predicted nucleic acid-binding protein